MSQLGGTAFEDKYNNAGTGKFKSGQSRGIGSDDYREFTTDIKDSFVNKTDGAYATIKGLNPGINTIAGLKAITTTGLAVGPYVSFRDTDNADAYRCYQLVAGTDTESSPDIIRPTDYAASTNEKVWKLAVVGGGGASGDQGGWDWNANGDALPLAWPVGGYGYGIGDRSVIGDPTVEYVAPDAFIYRKTSGTSFSDFLIR